MMGTSGCTFTRYFMVNCFLSIRVQEHVNAVFFFFFCCFLAFCLFPQKLIILHWRSQGIPGPQILYFDSPSELAVNRDLLPSLTPQTTIVLPACVPQGTGLVALLAGPGVGRFLLLSPLLVILPHHQVCGLESYS